MDHASAQGKAMAGAQPEFDIAGSAQERHRLRGAHLGFSQDLQLEGGCALTHPQPFINQRAGCPQRQRYVSTLH